MTEYRMLISKEKQRYKEIDRTKVATGAYFTRKSSWLTNPVRAFLEEHISANNSVLDPFAGAGDILNCLCRDFDIQPHGYDISGSIWPVNDSLAHVPNPHQSIICTNPPYLAKHSARRKGLWNEVHQYYDCHYDLYELAIERSMEHATAGVFIIPETFLHSNFPKHHLRLVSVILDNPFTDTEVPVCVACFDKVGKSAVSNGRIYIGDDYSCHISKLDRKRYRTNRSQNIAFNNIDGTVALKAVDGVEPNDRIRFERANTFYYCSSKVRDSSRLLTYIKVEELDGRIPVSFLASANSILDDLRNSTNDLILSPFKGNNKSGLRRRRLDYALARYIINKSLERTFSHSRQSQ